MLESCVMREEVAVLMTSVHHDANGETNLRPLGDYSREIAMSDIRTRIGHCVDVPFL